MITGMAFPPVPDSSKKQINKAGDVLVAFWREPPGATAEAGVASAWMLASAWRACHAYPINTFQATLRTKLRDSFTDPIVAQRLKRLPTIIDKLIRYPAMKLTTMQDIGGVRAVLSSVSEAERLADIYEKKSHFLHELVDLKNYISEPRSQDGYRSIHLIYKYINKQCRDYDGLRLELQIRSRTQHKWATAVETMGTFLGQALKSRQGDKDWLDFFALISSFFAHREKRPPVPRFANLSEKQTREGVVEIEHKLQALAKMNGFSMAADQIIKGEGKGRFYHLIVLDSLQKTVQIFPYDRESFKQALADYSTYEAQAAEGKKIEPVLVSAGPLDKLRRAYPNFFLDVKEFGKDVANIVGST
jgi:putative GTP pyrophosphokinase